MAEAPAAHAAPAEGAECMCCMEYITSENYVEYRDRADGPWMPALFCQDCVGTLLSSQYRSYCERLAGTKCAAEQRRLLERGPPINVSDATAMPCGEDTNGEVHALWYAADGAEHSAKLEGSLEGEARQAFWDEQKRFRIMEGGDAEEQEAAAEAEAEAGAEGGGEA